MPSHVRFNSARRGPVVLLLGLLLAGTATPALAAPLFGSAASTVVGQGQVVDGSAYLAGNTVTVDGRIDGDLFCAGQDITVTGTVTGDVLCAGNTVTVTGTVGGSVRLAGNTVVDGAGSTGGASLAGNTVTLMPSATVGTDLTAAGNVVNVSGRVGRDLLLGAQTATVSGAVGRDATGSVEVLTVAPGGSITGNLRYTSNRDATIAPGSVQGDVQRTTPPPQTRREPTLAQRFWAAAWRAANVVALSLAVVLLLPRFVAGATAVAPRRLPIAGLVGLLAVVVVLPLALIAMATVVGVTVGFVLLSAFAFAALLAAPLSAYIVGRSILGSMPHPVASMALGALIVGVGMVLPYVGWLVSLVVVCLGLGLILFRMREQYRTDAPAPAAP